MYLKRFVLCISFLVLSIEAGALTVYNNFSGNLTFDCCNGSGIGSLSDIEIGMLFSPSESGILNSINVAASNSSGNGEIEFSLYSSESGKPGSILENFTLSNLPDFGTSFQAQTLVSQNNVYLDSSSSYWMVASQPNFPDTAIWNYSDIVAGSTLALRDNNLYSTWAVMPHEYQYALRVDVTPVPVPPSFLLLISGLIGFLRFHRKLR